MGQPIAPLRMRTPCRQTTVAQQWESPCIHHPPHKFWTYVLFQHMVFTHMLVFRTISKFNHGLLGNTMNVLERLFIVRPNLCFEHKKVINTCFVVGGDLIAFGPWTGPCPWLHVSFSLTRARCHAMYCNHYSTWRPCLWRAVLQAAADGNAIHRVVLRQPCFPTNRISRTMS